MSNVALKQDLDRYLVSTHQLLIGKFICMLVHSISQYIVIQLYRQLCFADILLKGVLAATS